MSNRRCFFIGHRDAPEEVRVPLAAAIEQHITTFGVAQFVVGHYGQFDWMAAQEVAKAKLSHPDVKLTMLLPYHPAQHSMELPDGFDDSFYPFEAERIPKKAAIIRANRYMVGHSDYLIAYVAHTASNARNLLEYAQKYKRKIPLVITELNVSGGTL